MMSLIKSRINSLLKLHGPIISITLRVSLLVLRFLLRVILINAVVMRSD